MLQFPHIDAAEFHACTQAKAGKIIFDKTGIHNENLKNRKKQKSRTFFTWFNLEYKNVDTFSKKYCQHLPVGTVPSATPD